MLQLTLPFPNVGFGLVFAGLLLAFLARASVIDWRTLKIPKPLTVSLFFTGLGVSMLRGLWLGVQGQAPWVLHWTSPLGGAIEGLLFALSGAAVGFGLFFPLWMTRVVVGGGDVKLVTAAGTWLGPWGLCLAMLCSLLAFTVMGVGRIVIELSQGVMPSLAPRPQGVAERKARRRISYSLSFSFGVLCVLLLALQRPLGITPVTDATSRPTGANNAERAATDRRGDEEQVRLLLTIFDPGDEITSAEHTFGATS